MSAKSLDAQIAEHQAAIARLKQKKEKERTREKILVGASYISMAENNPDAAQRMITHLEKTNWRDVDRKIIDGLLARLKEATE